MSVEVYGLYNTIDDMGGGEGGTLGFGMLVVLQKVNANNVFPGKKTEI